MLANVYGFDGAYQIDEIGNIFSVERVIFTRHKTQRTKTIHQKRMAVCNDRRGYPTVILSREGKSKGYRVHRILMLTFRFVENHASLDVNHIDGNKENNSLENLEWATRSENIMHSFHVLNRKRTMTGKFGALHHNAKPVVGYDKRTKQKVHEFDSLASADRAGFCMSKISQCLSGQRKTHKGLIWTPPNIEPFVCKS